MNEKDILINCFIFWRDLVSVDTKSKTMALTLQCKRSCIANTWSRGAKFWASNQKCACAKFSNKKSNLPPKCFFSLFLSSTVSETESHSQHVSRNRLVLPPSQVRKGFSPVVSESFNIFCRFTATFWHIVNWVAWLAWTCNIISTVMWLLRQLLFVAHMPQTFQVCPISLLCSQCFGSYTRGPEHAKNALRRATSSFISFEY